jgi:hypothetical protein
MKRVIAIGLVCVVVVAQGCSANRVQVTPRRSVIHQPNCPQYPRAQAQIPPVVESEELKIRRLETIAAAVIVAGRVTFEILRVIR